MNLLQEHLATLGLSKNEINAYCCIFEYGVMPASAVAIHTQMKRSTAQYTCQQLLSRGLCSMRRKGNVHLYTIESVDNFLSILARQKYQVEKKEKAATFLAEMMKKKKSEQMTISKIKMFDGIAGIQQLVRLLPEKRYHVYSISAGEYFSQKIPKMVEAYRLDSKKRTMIAKKVIRPKKYKGKYSSVDLPKTQTRYLRSDTDTTVDVQIIDDTVTIISLDGKKPIGLLMQHQEIARAFIAIFEELWGQLES